MSPSIKVKLLAASLLVLLLAALAQRTGAGAAAVARAALGLAAAGGLALWMVRARRGGATGRFQLPPRLSVAARAGLSARCGVALVEADGRRFLVAYGDGFAQLLNALPPSREGDRS
ncbi:MAG TPA: flagellar biosynthetic protein FliO [Myxococcales bacterium]|nr:flagellar biosynthetic protein FliO [Myxococcales bacterium]